MAVMTVTVMAVMVLVSPEAGLAPEDEGESSGEYSPQHYYYRVLILSIAVGCNRWYCFIMVMVDQSLQLWLNSAELALYLILLILVCYKLLKSMNNTKSFFFKFFGMILLVILIEIAL